MNCLLDKERVVKYPCSPNCHLFGDCLIEFEKQLQNEDKAEKIYVELPCEVGTQVWLTEWWDHSHLRWTKQSTPLPRHIKHFDITKDGVFAHFNDGCINVKYFSEIVFFTKEEAKAHLKENNNGHS